MLVWLFLANLSPIECPKWLPGTNVILADNVHLTREQEVKNLMRCYCEIVKKQEALCIRDNDREACRERTNRWFQENVAPLITQQAYAPPRRQLRVLSIEP